ncbi:MAG: hypothetical protein AVDCRST_MAG67-3219 [uncultured Solirubrobacteraceae bacterium]|uniref:Uncharacterized protein n=1 Tax=uncultured Solirubrobacteraceae bacterium TaxID=1162706 RepID=A0A6J4TC01_9ACTN|nr:MAG: hypothetical protein AVDCRST_MAG67-3219 [uncultured Solirubrobacteraceae bacterium]
MSSGGVHSDAYVAMRRRLQHSLENQLSWVPVWFGDRISEHMLSQLRAQLPLLVTLGALSDDEAAAWRARVARVEHAWRASEDDIFDDAVKLAAAEILEKRFNVFAQSEPGTTEALGELHAALRPLRALRLISKDEDARWSERIHAAISEKRPERPEHPDRPYRAANLQQVVACPSQRAEGVRLTCLELYSDCTILRWHRVLSHEQAGDALNAQREARDDQAAAEVGRRFAAAFELTDDVGTSYAAAGEPRAQTGRWQSIDTECGYPLWGASPFVPAIPQQARRLEARHADDWFTIDLR